jgi:4-hydroxyphenylpyruvate dioxygenase
MTIATEEKTNLQTTADFLPLQGTDYVEFYVGNAKQAAHYYMSAFGFQAIAYAGPETGMKDKVSYVVRQNKLTFVLTTSLRMDNEIADHVYKHGECKVSGFAGRRCNTGMGRNNKTWR